MAPNTLANDTRLNALRSVWLVGIVVLGCSGGGSGSSAISSGELGYCADSCTVSCGSDDDCDISAGQLCCALSSTEKICLAARLCPLPCTDNSVCDVASGQICARTSIASTQKYCVAADLAVATCQTDTDCSTGTVCCSNYKESFCLQPSLCPKSCNESADCQTSAGEICCKTVSQLEPNLAVSALCATPDDGPSAAGYPACPRACESGLDCSFYESCCNGLCTTDLSQCPSRCHSANDCDGQLCCPTPPVRVPAAATYVFAAGKVCAGTPIEKDCSSSYCSGVPGCATPGICNDAQTTCSAFVGTESICNSVAGCSYRPPTGTCSSILTVDCSAYAGNETRCSAVACTYDTASGACTAGPPCGDNTTDVACRAQFDCLWSGEVVGSCEGTPAPCNVHVTAETCRASRNCAWTSTGTTCVGTPSPCNRMTPGYCGEQMGCFSSTSPTTF